jgi:acetoin:2,6-dichlorophenolindophenol oxidoreductase subunit beta
MPEMTFLEATLEAIREEMRRDESIFAIGEDSGIRGGSWPIFKGIEEEFGPNRLIGTPVCEGAATNVALGAAMTGMRPIVGLHFDDFMLRAIEEIGSQVARARYTFGGQCSVPLVIRSYEGIAGSAGTQHSGSFESIIAHFPGLKVAVPSVPSDAKGLLKSALRDDNPVVFLEHKTLLSKRGEVPEGEYTIELGLADIKRQGTDVTIACYGVMAIRALEAAEELAAEGISAEVLDLRTLSPLDRRAIATSVSKTGRLVIAHESTRHGGFGGEIAATAAELAYDALEAPIVRIAVPDVPIPFSPPLERSIIPGATDIAAGVRKVLELRVSA